MWNHLCVYNPELGDEDTVEQQLLFTHGSADFVKLIGLSQGIAELSYAFGNVPAKWFEAVGPTSKNISIVVPLTEQVNEEQKDSNWRYRYWFAGEYTIDPDALPPQAAFRSVEIAFKQHCLIHGNNYDSKTYWSHFWETLNNLDFTVSSLVAPYAIKLAPGTFNPEIANAVVRHAHQNNAVDVLIATEDGAVYPGSRLPFEVRREVLRWLDFGGGNRQRNRHNAHPKVPTPPTDHQDEASAETPDLSPNKPRDHDVTQSSSGLVSAFTKYIPFGMPELPALRVPSLNITAPLWGPKDDAVKGNDGIQIENAELHNIDGSKLYATCWTEGLYTYVAIFRTKVQISSLLQALVYPLSSLMEGFSFAFAPPVRFYYMVINNQKDITTTFPDQISQNEVFLTLLNEFPNNQEVVRLGSTWLYFTALSNGARVVFGKKNIENVPNFLGSLHSDVHQWIVDYKRKYMI